ncbi:LytTR family DNA-binding domain-containing protein [Butyricicoccus faecihominis]|uniref:LytR/AlgR family response regulator transcription factor n=1 Tax=Butyricicoccus faecihominis TaxID=1712515 RepID=UPI002478966F|nr:LytTR family DNA-binding domain-containing protein [Butyricicoccus faecihominis]MCQ5129926.1 LytTR family DNA-binding domain-containing protein [Butyricicoccus faecihominis]
MNIAICDDEKQELQHIQALLAQYDPTLQADVFYAAADLLQAFENSFYDLVLLDIEMPEPTGYQAAEQLSRRAKPPLVIFTTKNTGFAVSGYGVAFRFLVKPIQFQEFCTVMDAALCAIAPATLSFTQDGELVILPTKDIYYIETFKFTAIIHSKDETYETRLTLKQAERELAAAGFCRIHNSYLVNLQYVSRISLFTTVLIDGTEIPISRARKKDFQDTLQKYLRSH